VLSPTVAEESTERNYCDGFLLFPGILQQLLNIQIANITTAAHRMNITTWWNPIEVNPTQQPKALAVIKNKYPAKPMIPNKSATFARTVRILMKLKSHVSKIRITTLGCF
jgi:hypothetical protein